jgi:hypothetical protein
VDQKTRLADVPAHLDNVISEILRERRRQDARFGAAAGFGDDPDSVKLAVLQKKLGDYAVALAQEGDRAYFEHLKLRSSWQELIELAAVCVALLESDQKG